MSYGSVATIHTVARGAAAALWRLRFAGQLCVVVRPDGGWRGWVLVNRRITDTGRVTLAYRRPACLDRQEAHRG